MRSKPTAIVEQFHTHDGWSRMKGSFVTPSWSKTDASGTTWAKSESTFANIGISDYIAILREVSLYPQWIPGCTEARLIRRVKPQESMLYMCFEDVEFYVHSCFEFHPELGCASISFQSDVEDGITVTEKTGDMNWNMLVRPLPDNHIKVQSLMGVTMRPGDGEQVSSTNFLETTAARVLDIAAEKAFNNTLDHMSLMEGDKLFYSGFVAPGVRSLDRFAMPSTSVVKPPGAAAAEACQCPIKHPVPMVAPARASEAAFSQSVVSYHTLIWGWMWISLILFTVDRFWWDVWPMWVSKDLPDADKTTTPVNIFLLWAWGSGRVSIITTFFLFLTQCRVTMNYFGQNAPSWLYVGDIHQINNDLHWWMGILTGVAIVIHVWIIFLPAIVDGTEMVVLPTQAERKKVSFFDAESGTLNMAPDDVWRLCEITVMFGLFFPYSMAMSIKAGRINRYTVSMWIHLIAGLGFAVDIIRKESHPHSHRINVPMCIYWVMDRAVGLFLYRVNTATITAMDPLDDRYVVAYLKFEGTPEERKKIPEGEYVYMQFEGFQMDYAHPYTVFRNRGPLSGMRHGRPKKVTYDSENKSAVVFKRMPTEVNVEYDTASSGAVAHEGERNMFSEGKSKLSVWHHRESAATVIDDSESDSSPGRVSNRSGDGAGDGLGELPELKPVVGRTNSTRPSHVSKKLAAGKMQSLPDYDFAAIVEVHKTQMDHAGVVMRKPWSQTLRDAHMQDKLVSLRCYGPYHAVFADLRDRCLNLPGLLFVATGGGAAPALDFHQHIVHNKLRLRRPVMVVYSCNSPALFAYVTSILFSTRIPNFYVRGFITNSANRDVTMEYSPFEARTEASWERDIVGLNERMALDNEMEDAKSLGVTDVYFCGAPGVGKNVNENCRVLGLKYHMGHTFG